MKTLHLLRHAKASEEPHETDHGRPLAKRGIKAAKDMADHLKAAGFKVDRVYCSSSRRTRETYDLISPALGRAAIAFRDRLYLVDPADLLDFITSLPDTADSVLLIGHNPTYHATSLSLSKAAARGHGDELAALKEKFPTGAMASIQFDVDNWKQVKPATGTLIGFVRPRDLE